MIETPKDIIREYPVRKSRKQKKQFREDVRCWFESRGYSVSEEKGNFGARNLVIGESSSARYLVTAHYDTCAVLPVPNLVTPCSLFWFLMYQLFVTALIFLAALVPAILIGVISGSVQAGFLIWYLMLLAEIYLVMAGPANRTNVNDNTSGVITVMETAEALPLEQRSKVCFVLFDLEEAGLLGSASYQNKHRKETRDQIILNLDCVGEGDDILLFPTGRLKRDKQSMAVLRVMNRESEGKRVRLWEKGFSVYPSDQANFPKGVGICALNKSPFGLYLSRIHTSRDTILDERNVKILCSCLVSMTGASTAE